MDRERLEYNWYMKYIQHMTCVYFRKHKELLENKDMLIAYKHAREACIGELREVLDISEEALCRIFDDVQDMFAEGDKRNECEKYKKEIMLYVEILADDRSEQKKKMRAWLLDESDGPNEALTNTNQ